MKIEPFVLFLIYVTTVTCQEDCHCSSKANCPYNCNTQCDHGWLGTSCLTQCHCLDKTGCPYNCNFQCDPGWLGTSCLTRNIALNRTAYQSSKGKLCGISCIPLPTSLAVDGDTRTDRTTRCSATGENQTTASLTVSFEHPQLIDRVGLYFPDQITEDRGDFQVWVGGTLCYQRSVTDEVSNYTEISCEQQLLGKTVSVVLPAVSNKYRKLALCEIQIYQCAKLFSGNTCDKPCGSCTTFCDQRTEQCYNRDANIAMGHTAMFMLNSSHGHYGTAAQVIDGNTADSNCAMVSGNNPWWEIQFTETRTINWMRIFWSSAVLPINFTVLVGNYTCYSQVSSDQPPIQFTFSCPVPPQGDTVRILRQGEGLLMLMLCEVEIYECVYGFYGSNCRHRCNCGAGEICDKSTGNCFRHTTSKSSTPTISTSTTTTQAMSTTIPTTTSTKLATTTTTSSESASSTLRSDGTTSSTPAASETTQATTTMIPTKTSTKLATTTTTSSESASSTSSTPAASETPTPKSATAAFDADGKEPGMITIIAAAVGGGVGLILIILIIAVACRWKRRKLDTPLDSGQNDASTNNHAHANLGFTNEAQTAIPIKAVQKEPPKPVRSTTVPQSEGTRGKPQAPKPQMDELPEDPEDEPAPEETSDLYYNHVPRAIPVSSLRGYVQDRLDGVGFGNEYAFLPAGLKARYETGKTADNNPKNRFKHIYAYDHSRVVLERDEEEEMEEETDYINASYIHGYNCPKQFIATQGPIPETVADFWLMVWQQKTHEIIMLANIFEQERKKCEKYWPSQGEPGNYGIINVCVEKTKQHADYTVRVFTLHHLGEDRRREVTQYHFTTWPDHGVPSMPSLVNFWRSVRRQMTSSNTESGPTVVHCSAGIGRTGTYIGLDSLVEEAETEGKVNIFTAVLGMRDDRVNMVQTKGQYAFLHLAILEALHSKNTWTQASQIREKLAQGNPVIQKEYQNMNAMTSLRIPEEKKKDRGQGSTKQQEIENQDVQLNELTVTYWPSYFAKRGFLHVGVCEGDAVEEFWSLVYRKNVTTIVTVNQNTPTLFPTTVGQSSRIGPVDLILTSKHDVSAGIVEWKLTAKSEDEEAFMDVGEDKKVVVYNVTSTEPRFDNLRLLSLINLITDRQQTGGDQPVILQSRDNPSKCALVAAAANVITCLRLDQEVDIYLTVREIQCHKGQPVTCLEDYRSLYELANDYVQSANTYANM